MQGPSVGPIFFFCTVPKNDTSLQNFFCPKHFGSVQNSFGSVQNSYGSVQIFWTYRRIGHYVPGMENRRRCPDPYPAMTSPLAILFQIVSVVTGNSP